MYYTTYVRYNAIAAIVIWVLLTALFVAVLGPGGFLLGVLFGLVILFGFALAVVWARNAIDHFGGAMYPGWWGAAGVTIQPDPPRSGSAAPSPAPPSGVLTGGSRGVEAYPWTEDPSMSRAPAPGPAGPDVRACARCGTITTGTDSKYCRSCRASLDGAETIETLPVVTCARCGAATRGRASRFCRVCGSPLA
jgi:RNA polymerase subunit RPABC4/transcription elongation factor Spt4